MIPEITGPQLREEIALRCFVGADKLGHSNYVYIDDAGKRSTEWASNRIRIRAYFVSTTIDLLDQLDAELRALPGCLSTTKVVGHPVLRPLVEAVFDRQAAASMTFPKEPAH